MSLMEPKTESAARSVVDFEFLNTMLHNVSQPLTVARGVLELALLTARTTSDYREAIQESIDQIDVAVAMKSRIADLANEMELAERKGEPFA
jgi:signal transduction histidine kinase